MANARHNHWIIIDTASGSAVNLDKLLVNKIRWVGGATAGDRAVVQDAAGNTFWESVATGVNYVECDDFSTHGHRSSGRLLNGLIVPTLGSGKLYIYLD